MRVVPGFILVVAAGLVNLVVNSELFKDQLFQLALEKPYFGGFKSLRNYEFGGHTSVASQSHVRLTPNFRGRHGWLFSRNPSVPENFEFKIHGDSGYLHGDGMAIWIVDEPTHEGPVFGGKDKFKGIGIFVDMYKNNRPGITFPYIMGMAGDGQTSYNVDQDGAGTELGGCSAKGLYNARDTSKMKITYVKGGFLAVEIDYIGLGDWQMCFQSKAPELPKGAYLGFTAQTGDLSEHHDIIDIDARELVSPPMTFEKLKTENEKLEKKRQGLPYSNTPRSSGGGLLGFFKMLLKAVAWIFLLLLVGIGILWARRYFLQPDPYKRII